MLLYFIRNAVQLVIFGYLYYGLVSLYQMKPLVGLYLEDYRDQKLFKSYKRQISMECMAKDLFLPDVYSIKN